MTTAYTDGACVGNPGPGGWAWAVPGGDHASGAEPATTNQRMEVRAALEAVTSLPGELEIVSDSTYVVNCFRDRWWEGWLARGWRNSNRQPVANRDLWEPLIAAVRADAGRVRFRWVKGHGTDMMNDLVDRLAVEAARTQTGRRGTGAPSDLGSADGPTRHRGAPGPSAAAGADADARVPAGHRLAVGGLKPPSLGGYDPNPVAAAVAARLGEILRAKRELEPELVVLTGMGLGAEQLGAEAAAAAGVPYVAVLAFPGVEDAWPPARRARFAELLAGAVATLVVQGTRPTTRQAAAGALARRDGWLARVADEAIVVWDGDDAAVGRLVRSLQDHLGEEHVWVVRSGD